MDPQLAAHSGVFSLILQRMMLEAHAANGAILSHFGHVYPAGKDVSMPLLPLSRIDSKSFGVQPPSLLSLRKESVCAHKRQNLELKISLLKKRKQQLIENQLGSKVTIVSDDIDVEVCENEKNLKEGILDGNKNIDSPEVKVDLNLLGNTDFQKEICAEQVFKSPHAADVHFKKVHKKPAVRPPTDCEECGKRFASAFQLREHISIQHLFLNYLLINALYRKERNFTCEECGQKFGRRGGLRRHVQMVHQNHLHMCPYEGCDHPGYKCSKVHTLFFIGKSSSSLLPWFYLSVPSYIIIY
ncbi:zinc finger, C2H2 type [Dictyocaulus viviparus]|uniref:Zinc finger, C2H2 type n=1 Tax=Dictyocaulus viviparus TaxID=29172 RepID=A0A0D8Y4E9_DICVI|nr:zinc finger, C2H2 type [Dictyocaulus viviparus]